MEGDEHSVKTEIEFFIISIHTLRVEGDGVVCRFFGVIQLFQSTPSVWRVTFEETVTELINNISIHTLRVEGDILVERHQLYI